MLPVSVILRRLENHEAKLRADLSMLPWYKLRHRLILKGAIGAYIVEREQLLEISAGWQPFWAELGVSPEAGRKVEEPRREAK